MRKRKVIGSIEWVARSLNESHQLTDVSIRESMARLKRGAKDDSKRSLRKCKRRLVGSHEGDERELLEELDAVAEGWRMRLQELDDEASD